MSSGERESASVNPSDDAGETAELDAQTGQPVEEAEKNLSRHSTSDSSPSIEEQARTSVPQDEA